MNKNIHDLREHLFATLEALRDKTNPMEIERAKAIAGVAQTIINSAVVEVKHQELLGVATTNGFLEAPEEKTPDKLGVTVHRLKG